MTNPSPTASNQLQDIQSEIGVLLLEIGTLLMMSGANTQRIRLNVNRVSEAFGFQSELLITHQALMLTMSQNHKQVYSHLKRCSPHSVNFKILSGISRMSWAIVEENWPFEKIKEEVERLKAISTYPNWITILFVSLSGASFCRLFGGDFKAMAITFIATLTGIFVRQKMTLAKFNFYLSIFAASFSSTLISGFFLKLLPTITMEHAFASSILFLVPGIPLINPFSDFIDGNLLNGFLRGLNSLLICFAMALGWLLTVTIYKL